MYRAADIARERFPHTPSKEYLNTKNLDLSSLDKLKIVKHTGLSVEQWWPYHCKAVARLGADRYLDLAEMARKGKHPETLFSWLLKQELNKTIDTI